MTLPFEFFDVVVITALILSGLLGYFRGLVREVLSLTTWIGAVIVTLYAFSYVQPYVRQVISIQIVADIIAGVGLFLVTLVVLTLVNHTISGQVKDSVLSAIDRGLGFLFGLVRGALLVSVAYIAATWAWSENDLNPYMEDARTASMVKQGAEILTTIIPKEMRKGTRDTADTARDTTEQAVETKRLLDNLGKSGVSLTGDGKPPAYNKNERRDMQRLIDSKQ